MNKIKYLLFSSLIIFISCGGGDDPGKKETNQPSVGFDSGRSINESSTNVLLDIRLSEPSNQTISVTAKTVDGTAIAGEDYTAINTTIVFTPNDMQETLAIGIIGDNDFESDETFTVVLENPEGAVLGTASIVIEILNDDVDDNFFVPSTGYTTPTSYAGMTLLWQDEFSAASLNETYWNYEIGGNGWGNNELQYYRRENTFLQNGMLVIEARKENFGGRAYTSSRLTTQGKMDFQYGRVDIRAALPKGQGIWPALWMLGANFGSVGWPYCGEIDIMEMIGGGAGRDDTVHGTLHWDNNGSRACTCDLDKYTLSTGIFYNEFHVFSLKWTSTSIQWLVDDVVYGTKDITAGDLSEFQNDFFFIFNVAVGGDWPGSPDGSTVFTQRMIVDYVRVFQDNP